MQLIDDARGAARRVLATIGHRRRDQRSAARRTPMSSCSEGSGVRVARGIVFGGAMGGAMVVPVGNVAGERHIAARDLQQLPPLARIMQPFGRPQAAPGHSLVFFTRGH
jgi:hypothetical protein